MSFVLNIAEQITRELDDIIRDVCPSSVRHSKYGGIVFAREADNPNTMVCGHFTYKQHVGLEFSNGYQLDDPDGVLEGNGKYRRHIKLFEPADIERKHVRSMIERAFANKG